MLAIMLSYLSGKFDILIIVSQRAFDIFKTTEIIFFTREKLTFLQKPS